MIACRRADHGDRTRLRWQAGRAGEAGHDALAGACADIGGTDRVGAAKPDCVCPAARDGNLLPVGEYEGAGTGTGTVDTDVIGVGDSDALLAAAVVHENLRGAAACLPRWATSIPALVPPPEMVTS